MSQCGGEDKRASHNVLCSVKVLGWRSEASIRKCGIGLVRFGTETYESRGHEWRAGE